MRRRAAQRVVNVGGTKSILEPVHPRPSTNPDHEVHVRVTSHLSPSRDLEPHIEANNSSRTFARVSQPTLPKPAELRCRWPLPLAGVGGNAFSTDELAGSGLVAPLTCNRRTGPLGIGGRARKAPGFIWPGERLCVSPQPAREHDETWSYGNDEYGMRRRGRTICNHSWWTWRSCMYLVPQK